MQDYFGRQSYVITGTGFPSDFSNSPLLCRFEFTDGVNQTTVGQLESSSRAICSPEKHFSDDTNVTLRISFNGQQYHTLPQKLTFHTDNRMRFNMTQFANISDTGLFGEILQL
jgi:hypothetical protein